ncbi:MAG: GNAT family N-acetyltransferase [Chitinophagales bacterium]
MLRNDHTAIDIRKAGKNDVTLLADLSRRTFYDTYHMFNTPENMDIYISGHFNELQIAVELTNPVVSIFIATYTDTIVGYIKLDLVNYSSIPNGNGMEVSRFYVDKDFQNLGAGKLLMNKAVEFARENNCNYLWLGVWQKNLRAVEIYEHLGFAIKGTTTFLLGDDEQEDFVMVKKLKDEEE